MPMPTRFLMTVALGACIVTPAVVTPAQAQFYYPGPVVVARPPPVIVRPRVVSSLTFAVQNELGMAGYQPGPPDGVFGPRTSAAIFAYQQQNGLPVDGLVSAALLENLRARRTAATQPPVPRPAPTQSQAAAPTVNNAGDAAAIAPSAGAEGQTCRQFQQPGKTGDGKDITTTGTACLQKDGTWKPTN
jgi:peptidoglycan hydrolase-like protein with peptidoglycan-binding domain